MVAATIYTYSHYYNLLATLAIYRDYICYHYTEVVTMIVANDSYYI